MKIFISHSSANKEYGNLLVELLRGVGIKEDEIIFTSNIAYGIPIGENIFNWLKSQISEKPFVIYLLSKEYYSSIACLNEMGAAWVIENEHAMLFTPNFDLSSKEFQNGAIDPREIGFFIDDEERLFSFIQHLEKYFSVSRNSVLINQKTKKYLHEIASIKQKETKPTLILATSSNGKEKDSAIHKEVRLESITLPKISTPQAQNKNDLYAKFMTDILTGKLKDEEVIMLHYISDTGRIKLMTGWQGPLEIDHIKTWEEIHEINDILSNNYDSVIRKFGIRGYTKVSAVTSSDNPKEVKLKPEIEASIMDLPQEVIERIKSVLENNRGKSKKNEGESLPF